MFLKRPVAVLRGMALRVSVLTHALVGPSAVADEVILSLMVTIINNKNPQGNGDNPHLAFRA